MKQNNYNNEHHPLANVREKINTLDANLLKLLAERRQLATEVIEIKLKHNIAIKDVAREQALINSLIEKGKIHGLDEFYIKSLYEQIIRDSVHLQTQIVQNDCNPASNKANALTVAFLGPEGSYSHTAMKRFSVDKNSTVTELSCPNFRAIFNCVDSANADLAVIPIENSSSGSINEVYDLLQKTELHIVAELFLPIEHCILAKTPTKLSDISSLYSHSQPFQQCSDFLSHYPEIKLFYCDSSSSAMQTVANLDDERIAAIGNKESAALFGLHVIADNLANQKENVTRFVILAQKPINVSANISAKTTLLMKTGQQAGALVDALSVFRQHNIAMTKLESRPITGTPWEEMFYIDFIGNISDNNVQHMLHELKNITLMTKVLGCYPAQNRFEQPV